MALRWRNHGRGPLLCAATSDAQPDDTHIDDALHYKLSVELRVLVPDANERDNGRWYWIDDADCWQRGDVERLQKVATCWRRGIDD